MMGSPVSPPFLHTLVAVTILTAPVGNAQVQDPERLLAEGDRLAFLFNWPKAEPLYAQAETLFNQSGDKKNALYARLGWIWSRADTGAAVKFAGELESDIQSPTVQGDPKLMLRCLVAKAAIEQEKNEASARDIWEQILGLANDLRDERWKSRAKAELGIIAFMDGDVEQATGMLKTALISLYLQGDLGAAIYYGSIVGNGLVEVGQPEVGLQYCDTGLKTAATTKDMGFPFIAYEGKARALIALHREVEAKQLLNLAVEQARANRARAAEVQLLIVMGKQAATTDPKQAIEYLKAAVNLSKEVGFRHALAWSTVELARVYRDRGDLDSAEQYATEAMEAMKEVQDQYHLPLHIALLAELETRKGKYAEADRLYDQAGDVVEALLVNVRSRQVETSLISTVSEIYVGHFTLAATKLGDLAKAYQILETARGRAIADTLRSGHVNLAPTDSLMRAAAREVSQVQLALLQEPSAQKRGELLDRLFAAEQILAPVGKPQTPLQLATRRAEPVKLATLETSLRPDEMVLEYLLDEPRSFCLHITRATAAVSTLPAGRKQIEEAVDNFLSQVKSKKPSAKTGQELYSLLLSPIPGVESQKRLIIVPDGKLHLLPFDSLTDQRGRYVLTSHTVSFAPSASVLYLVTSSPVTRQPPLSFLGVGDVQYKHEQSGSPKNEGVAQTPSTGAVSNPFELSGARLRDVPNTRDEVIAAGQVFGAGAKLLLGPDATEGAFKSQPLADFKIIHIAAHGIASPKFPDRAALVLGNDPKAGEDGLLQVREIRDLDLNADLVTLSACDTGTGQLQGEEGIANLVRAFLFAGAKSALASLWTASDISTRTLMGHFYRYIVEGEDEATALRKAKADLIEEFGDQALPFYWAGFILVGNASNRIALPRHRPQKAHTPTPAYPR